MNPTLIFATQIVVNLSIFGLIARWYIQPALDRRPFVAALTPLLLVHMLRTLGLVFLVPGPLGAALPEEFATNAALGDLFTAILAFASLVALRNGWRGTRILLWIFSIFGIFDLLNGFAHGISADLVGRYVLGPLWFIPTVLVPILFVTHALVIGLLLARRNEAIEPNGGFIRHLSV